ncbi:MAG: acetyltransferase [Opitutales bacterium]|jgi:sugar O-acyltransferase (sialic acid O-acetyltransferase NeuD family)
MSSSSNIVQGKRPLVIVGAGGFGMEVLWVVSRISAALGPSGWNVIGFVDDKSALQGVRVDGVQVLGKVNEFLERYAGQKLYFHCAIGKNRHRQRLAELFESHGFLPATLIDPLAAVSPHAEIGLGSYIAPQVCVAPLAKVGRHVLINMGSSVGHHCQVDDYAQACPGTRMNGKCVVEKLAFLGSNVTLQPGKRVGEGATVGASSFVLRNVPPYSLVMGVPARLMQYAPPAGQRATEIPFVVSIN